MARKRRSLARKSNNDHKYENNLAIANIREAYDPTHSSRCRIVHAEQISCINALSGSSQFSHCCDAFVLGRCRNPACTLQHPVNDWYYTSGDMNGDVPRWADDHARRMNRVLWNELWTLEHQVHFLHNRLLAATDPRKISQRERKRARRQERRYRDLMIREAYARKFRGMHDQ
jgi:hypothetical protein